MVSERASEPVGKGRSTGVESKPSANGDGASGWTIEPATKECCRELGELALRSKAVWGYDDDFMRACADELAVDPRHVADPAWTIELARDETNLLGFVAVSFDAQPAELEAMFVAPEALGRRLGEHLMTRALVACARRGRSSLSIQSDPNAEDFYCRMGAVRVGRQESASIAGRFLPRLVLPLEAMTIGSRTHALWIRPVSRSICGAGMEVLVDGRVIGRLDTPSTDGAADSCVVDWPGGAAIAARIDGLRSRRVGLAHE